MGSELFGDSDRKKTEEERCLRMIGDPIMTCVRIYYNTTQNSFGHSIVRSSSPPIIIANSEPEPETNITCADRIIDKIRNKKFTMKDVSVGTHCRPNTGGHCTHTVTIPGRMNQVWAWNVIQRLFSAFNIPLCHKNPNIWKKE